MCCGLVERSLGTSAKLFLVGWYDCEASSERAFKNEIYRLCSALEEKINLKQVDWMERASKQIF